MKLPATESKGDSPMERQSQRLTASKIQSSIQAPVQASVRRIAKSLASIAPQPPLNQRAAKGKIAKGKIARDKISEDKIAKDKINRQKSSVEKPASPKAASQGSVAQKTHPEASSVEKSAKTKAVSPSKSIEANAVNRKNPVPNLPFINKDSKAARVTFTLLLVRPWVLVAGLWLVSLLGSAAALQGLIRPRALMQALPEAVVEAPPVLTSSIINVVEGEDLEATETADAEVNAADASAETTVAAANEGGFPVWTVSALVGACTAGCLVMSRRRAMARASASRAGTRAKGRVRRKPVSPDAVRTVDTVKRLKQIRKPVTAGAAAADVRELSRIKKRRQRNKRVTAPMTGPQTVVAKGRKASQKQARQSGQKVGQKVGKASQGTSQGNRVLVSRSAEKKANASGHPARVRRVKKGAVRPARRQAMVSVVPASESHALDWSNGSLAHEMDVRSQRKIAM